jgi:hypothetical protein
MVIRESTLPQPEPAAKIWRFMTVAELVSLVSERALFFTRVDKLDDPFEGSLPKSVLEQAENGFEKLTSHGQDMIRTTRQQVGYVQSKLWTMVNCWYINEHESAAMWKLHAPEGVAVQSTVEHLVEVMQPDSEQILVGPVRYIDYEREGWAIDNDARFVLSIFHKRKSFEHERELRAVISKSMPGGIYNVADGPGYLDPAGTPGIYVSVDLKELVEKIHVSPGSPAWLRNAVKRIAASADLGQTVVQSQLDSQALW